jgi:hypothetical protein
MEEASVLSCAEQDDDAMAGVGNSDVYAVLDSDKSESIGDVSRLTSGEGVGMMESQEAIV